MNLFGKEFYQSFSDNLKKQHLFFTEEIYIINETPFTVYEFHPTREILNNCYRIADQKSQHTMDENQNLEIRTIDQKVIKQFYGILAECATHIYLHVCTGIPLENILRWDLERPSFKDAKNEYDIKIKDEMKNDFDEMFKKLSGFMFIFSGDKVSTTLTCENDVIYKKLTATASVNFSPGISLSMFGISKSMTADAQASVTISNPDNFIRDTDFLVDMIMDTGAGREVKKYITNGAEIYNTFKGWFGL